MTNLKYEKEYTISTYECDKNSNLRLITLFNILQDMADGHAEKLNLGLSWCLENAMAWVGSNYHVKIERMPKMHEKIKVVSWPSAEKRIAAIRDFIVFDNQGNEIIKASSVWVLIDVTRKRPLSLKTTLPEYSVNPERALETDFNKLPPLEKTDYSKEFSVRFDDIDINGHVNNSIYPIWASEALEKSFRCSHNIKEIEIEFKKEAFYEDDIIVNVSLDRQVSSHKIIAKEDLRELSKVRISWG